MNYNCDGAEISGGTAGNGDTDTPICDPVAAAAGGYDETSVEKQSGAAEPGRSENDQMAVSLAGDNRAAFSATEAKQWCDDGALPRHRQGAAVGRKTGEAVAAGRDLTHDRRIADANVGTPNPAEEKQC